MQNWEESLHFFELALSQSKKAKDSQNIALSYEGMGSTHSRLENYDKSEEYYEKALPLIEKFCSKSNQAVAYSNYANLLSYQGKSIEAIQVFENVLTLCRNNNIVEKEVLCMLNLANEYTILEKYDKALELYYLCLEKNIKHDWLHYLVTNYLGISYTYESKGEFDRAFYYLEDYYLLKDSIMGIDVRSQIAELEAENEKGRIDLQVHKTKSKLDAYRNRIKWIWFISIFIITLLTLGLFVLYRERLRTSRELKQNQENLNKITNTLIAKNKILKSLSDQLLDVTKSDPDSEPPKKIEKNLYNLRILTKQDWASFKLYFERIHPDYIMKIRKTIKILSEA